MHNTIAFLVCFFIVNHQILQAQLISDKTDSQHQIFRIFQGTSPLQEVSEGLLMTRILIADLELKSQSAWFKTPWMPSKLNREGSDKLTKDLVPISGIYLFGIVPNVAIIFLPNNI
ncbi:MAG: hypothetical protein HQK83_00140 [Fibrobacteria bacterium]|nr:hypothetical protein [Fibrobacteria bacterium]